jgi:type II secretory pathway pseudopilin PulG
MNAPKNNRRRSAAGMTLVEILVATAVGTMVIAASLTLFILFLRSYNTTLLMRNTADEASFALERMVIGVGTNAGLREASGSTVTLSNLTSGWKLSYNTNFYFQYVASSQRITNDSGKLVCANVVTSSVSLLASNSCRVSISVAQSAGGRTWTNTFLTQIQFRN